MQIFGNDIKKADYKKAVKTQKKFIRKFGDDRDKIYHLALKENEVLEKPFGCKTIVIDNNASGFEQKLPEKPIIIGNIITFFNQQIIDPKTICNLINRQPRCCIFIILHSDTH